MGIGQGQIRFILWYGRRSSDLLNRFVGGLKPKTKRPPFGRPCLLVEVAGQLIHIFRYGLDYAFIRSLVYYEQPDAGRIIRLRES